jgi:hypothetical protein
MALLRIKFLVTFYNNFFIYCSQRLDKNKFPTDAVLLLYTVQKFFLKLAFIEVFIQIEGHPCNQCCCRETLLHILSVFL